MKEKDRKISKVILWIVLVAVAVIQLFPLIWLVDFSLGSSNEMFTNGVVCSGLLSGVPQKCL